MAEAVEPTAPAEPDAAAEPAALPEPAAEPDVAEAVVPLLLREEKTYPTRFRIAIFALGILLGVVIAGFIVVALHDSPKPAPFAIASGAAAGGGWGPTCDTEFGCDRPHQIAAYVAPRYQSPDGKDIVGIISGRPTTPSQDGVASDVPVILERNDRGSRVVYTAPEQDNTVQYSLCGFGTACALTGKPSVARGDLLRRQALELALLTFRFAPGVKSVLAFFPKAAKAADPSYLLFFRRQDYDQQLSKPLAATLGKQVVLKTAQMPDALARSIGKLTSSRVFTYRYQLTQQGFPILMLTPAAY